MVQSLGDSGSLFTLDIELLHLRVLGVQHRNMRGFIADDGVGQPHGVSCRVLKEDVEADMIAAPADFLHALGQIGQGDVPGPARRFLPGGEAELGELLEHLGDDRDDLGPEGLGGDHQAGEGEGPAHQKDDRRLAGTAQGGLGPARAVGPADEGLHAPLEPGGGGDVGQLALRGQLGQHKVPGRPGVGVQKAVQLLIGHTSTPISSKFLRRCSLARWAIWDM